nr:immunoglobulin light chain junction region [Macaca mulatta]MOX90553.1 immunoglobulin light chain junction region [Macaca mulatta]
CLQYNTDPFTF